MTVISLSAPMARAATTELLVNGTAVDLPRDSAQSLASFLRDGLSLLGAKIGCGNGECGACTVLVDGRAICSCLYPIGRAVGRDVTTIEGLDHDGEAERIRAALIAYGAFQCGFCTPGMIVSLVALFRSEPSPSDEVVRAALQGNVCRCSGYVKLLEAVQSLRGPTTP
jgi:carbon-monoxide dehydrogenase small subunit